MEIKCLVDIHSCRDSIDLFKAALNHPNTQELLKSGNLLGEYQPDFYIRRDGVEPTLDVLRFFTINLENACFKVTRVDIEDDKAYAWCDPINPLGVAVFNTHCLEKGMIHIVPRVCANENGSNIQIVTFDCGLYKLKGEEKWLEKTRIYHYTDPRYPS